MTSRMHLEDFTKDTNVAEKIEKYPYVHLWYRYKNTVPFFGIEHKEVNELILWYDTSTDNTMLTIMYEGNYYTNSFEKGYYSKDYVLDIIMSFIVRKIQLVPYALLPCSNGYYGV